MQSLIKLGEDISGKTYVDDDYTGASRSLRIIADHARSVNFLISDGVLPGNEGRGYVLRRLLRRAVFHGRLLGIEDAFLGRFIDAVNDVMGDAYPSLLENVGLVKGIVEAEEERFSTTLNNGRVYLDEQLSALAEGEQLPGSAAFMLHDTFGFPIDLPSDRRGRRARRSTSRASTRRWPSRRPAPAPPPRATPGVPSTTCGPSSPTSCRHRVRGLRQREHRGRPCAGHRGERRARRARRERRRGRRGARPHAAVRRDGRPDGRPRPHRHRRRRSSCPTPPPRAASRPRGQAHRSAFRGRRRVRRLRPQPPRPAAPQPHGESSARRRAQGGPGRSRQPGGLPGVPREPALRLHALRGHDLGAGPPPSRTW